MGRKKAKAKGQMKHTAKRGMERFGLTVSEKSIKAIVQQIQSGSAKFLEKQSNRVSLFQVKLEEGVDAVAVYDRERKTIATLLTTQMYTSGAIKCEID